MSFNYSPKVVTNGLVLCLDAANQKSYTSGSTTWYDLAGSNNGVLTNGPTYDTAMSGNIVFDGIDDSCPFYAPNLGTTTTLVSKPGAGTNLPSALVVPTTPCNVLRI